MRASAAKLALGVAAWVACAAATFVILQSEQQLSSQRNALRGFDVVAREAVAALSSLKAAQQGYVAPGQGASLWMKRVDTLLTGANQHISDLQKIATTGDARARLDEAAETLHDLQAIDKRARQYLTTNEAVMAADVLFSEGGETASMAGRQVEGARQSEYAAFDGTESVTRRQQVYAAGAAGLVTLLAIAGLVAWPSTGRERRPIVAKATEERTPAAESLPAALGVNATSAGLAREREPDLELQRGAEPALDTAPVAADATSSLASAVTARVEPPVDVQPFGMRPQVAPDLPRDVVPVLTAAADLCVELNRARDVDELTSLLERAAQVLDASGLVVWVGAPGASMLRPVLAHGYSPQALARMPHVPRTGDNAAATAFRTAKLQIVLTRPGMSAGALAAPMLTPNGCIGALTAEIRNGGEAHDGVQALMSIIGSQLAGVLAESVLHAQDVDEAVNVTRIASA